VTLLDVLGYLDEIPVCTAYEVDGRRVDDFPSTAVLERARPVYETLPGWRCDVSGARSFGELPAAAQSYVRAIETAVGVPVRWVSNGPRREQLIQIT
jgi:adenylosuccinate synthase